MEELQVQWWGLTDYAEALSRQQELFLARQQRKISDTLVVTEHRPVITLGSGTTQEDILVSEEEIALNGIKLCRIGRGGRVTYHGPGQLIIYPIIHLEQCRKDLHRYRWLLEEVCISVLKQLNLQGARRQGYPGIWVGAAKIASLGIQVRKWVTMHGLALNVTHHLEGFSFINPCGIKGCDITSLEYQLGYPPELELVAKQAVQQFSLHFKYSKLN